jgi:hypothetical protein
MAKKRFISRRQFLIGATAALGSAVLTSKRRTQATGAVSGPSTTLSPTLSPMVYLPFVGHRYVGWPYTGKVVHVHSPVATDWNGESDYWNYVDQEVVNQMVDLGLTSLTGTSTVAEAWRALIPAYQPGEKVAIKVNLVNTWSCGSTAPNIDALMQPINALARGLMEIGVAAEDICVYDAVRAVPDRIVDSDLHGVSFFDGKGKCYGKITYPCRNEAGFTEAPETCVEFHHPLGDPMPEEHVTDVLMNASYLINVPIMKGSHVFAGVTLGFKNHFGTIDCCCSLHDYVNVVGQPPLYRSDYNPLVDLMLSPLIGGKTVLTLGDGLFAARDFLRPPEPWETFDGQVPNSLFFAKDPVAIDCLMHDLLAAEPDTHVVEGSNNYLRLAAEAGLGSFEQGDPWQTPYGSGYEKILYVRTEL